MVIIKILKWVQMFVTRLPFSMVVLISCVFGNLGWIAMIYSIIADIVLNFIFVMWEISQHTKLMKNEFIPLLENSEDINDEIIEKFRAERKKLDPFFFMASEKLGNDIGLIVRKFRSTLNPTTLPFSYGKSIIVMSSDFDTSDDYCLTDFAHEIGHTIHSFLRQEYLITPIAFSIYLISLIVILIFHFSIALLVIVVLGGLVTLINWTKLRIQFRSLIEINADLLALQLLENLYGIEKMKESAKILTRKRMDSFRTATSKMEKYVYLTCIENLAVFIDEEYRKKIIDKSIKRSDSIRNNELIKFKGRILGEERRIRDIFTKKKYIQSSKEVSMCGFNFIDLLMLLLLLLALALYVPCCSLNVLSGALNLIIAVISFVIIFIFIYFKIKTLWEKDLKLTM